MVDRISRANVRAVAPQGNTEDYRTFKMTSIQMITSGRGKGSVVLTGEIDKGGGRTGFARITYNAQTKEFKRTLNIPPRIELGERVMGTSDVRELRAAIKKANMPLVALLAGFEEALPGPRRGGMGANSGFGGLEHE